LLEKARLDEIDQPFEEFPEDFYSLVAVYWNGARLRPIGRPPRSGDLGTSMAFYLEGNRIYYIPAPTAPGERRLVYMYVPAAMVDDDDVPDIPERWHDLLWLYAVARAHK